MKRKVLFGIGILLLGLVAYAMLIEPRMVGFTEHEVAIKGLPKAFDGFTIVQLTDIHVGVWVHAKGVHDLVRRVNARHADMVVLTGDYVNRYASNCEPSAEALAGLRAPHGIYAVLGNHDYWTDADRMTRALRAARIDVLFDEKRRVTVAGQSIWLVGTNDVWEGNPDYEKAFRGISAKDVCIGIAHNPDAVLSMKGRRVDLLMTGHTHGGVICLPGIGAISSITKLGRHYSSGMFEVNGIRFYVCRGAGTVIPFRFCCPPEVAVFTLRRAE